MSQIIDAFTLAGLLVFPLYLIYWTTHHVRMRAWKQLWGGVATLVSWLVTTFVCFIWPMLMCMGGHCAGKVSPFLQLAVLYAVSSCLLVYVLHRYRAGNAIRE